MTIPDEAQWARVEEIVEEIAGLAPDRVTDRLSELAAAGESPTVLTLVETWLGLPPPPSSFKQGSVLGERYVLREKIGEGGMGSVWRASQELIEREVAVKIIHPSLVTPALQSKFAGEIKILGQLNHPGIIKIFDAGVHHSSDEAAIPFFAMELVEGQPLDRWAAAHRKDRIELLRVATELCGALGSAHERQIVHRDLKPSNILVRKNGQPVLLDFGIARLRGFVLGEEEGGFSGTPQYAAPEQHLGRDHDFRSGESVDIYSVGVVLFEILSGRKLFEFERGASIAQIRRAVLETAPPRLTQVVPDCPAVLEEVVSRALRRDPADRFYSMAALGRAIARAARGIGSPDALPPPWAPAPRAIVPGTSWVLVEKIGEGGAGEVWMGVHKQLNERRVFKFCDSEEKARTLKREVTLFRLLKERVGRNPHFITLHEVSLDEPPWYLMMDYVDARDLESWCDAQTGGLASLPESKRLEIVAQAAEALQAAHEAGILHRDIKPANLLVRENAPATLHVFVADFGIGQIITDQLLRDHTRLGFTRTVSDFRTNRLSGTLLYLAPEVLEGSPATVRSDIYSLGVVLWQLLAGNLHAALDASDWPERISDPLLREVLRRCLAGASEKRWASAGELAANLRDLPERRVVEDRRRTEAAARERAAYRRGMLRTATVAAGIVLIIASLALLAFAKRREAESAHGEIALEQAGSLPRSDFTAGRRQKGIDLLEVAARTATNLPALRTAAASVFGLTDLLRGSPDEAPRASSVSSQLPKQTNEVFRAFSPDGTMLAIARDLDGLKGAIDFSDPNTGKLRFTVTRRAFPWVPIAEPGMLQFSPDNKLLAVAGGATSRHVLLLNTTNGTLRAYIFHGSDPISLAWHPGSRILATGCADGAIRIWDIEAAVSPKLNAGVTNQFDLPPNLDAPALDLPLQILKGQRDRVPHLVFAADGQWLAALDNAGYLRIFSGFPSFRRPQSDSAGTAAKTESSNSLLAEPVLALETRIENAPQVSHISALKDSVLIERGSGSREQFRLTFGGLPDELQVAPDLASLAWNGDGTELCLITLTDVYWTHSNPLELFFSAPGKNPNAVSWDQNNWLLPAGDHIEIFQLNAKPGALRLEWTFTTNLQEAIKGQGAQTSLASAGDGRAAVYRGRRIQFFARNTGAPLDTSVIANGGDGEFQEILWDAPGSLLGVVFSSRSNNLVRLESWKTSADFPPKCNVLPAASLECERVVPANDGRNFIARGTQHGLFLFDPTSVRQKMLNGSSDATQNAPLTCSDNGAFVATVVDRGTVRILRLPSGEYFADLHSLRASGIIRLQWDHSGKRLAAITEDGYLQVWNLSPWQSWLTTHHLE